MSGCHLARSLAELSILVRLVWSVRMTSTRTTSLSLTMRLVKGLPSFLSRIETVGDIRLWCR